MPETPLTEILSDFRSYRPGNHRQFLEWVKDRAQEVGVRGYAMMERKSAGKAVTQDAPCNVLNCNFSFVSSRAEPGPRFPMETLVLYPRIYLEKNGPPDGDWRKSHSTGKPPEVSGLLLLMLHKVAPQPAL